MARKEVLCFGDSNTWGYNPVDKGRYPLEVRWTGVLQRLLEDECRIVEEGLNGRTTVWDDSVEGDKNGLRHLGSCLSSHKPLDLVVIMLGTNDLKQRFSVPPEDIARSAARLVDAARKSSVGPADTAPGVLLVSPPPLGKLSELAAMFAGGPEKSAHLARCYQEQALLHGCPFFDAGTVVRTSDIDGVHWEPQAHTDFAGALAAVIRELLAG